MILSDRDIVSRLRDGECGSIEPWDDGSLQPASYDLHLASEYVKFKEPCYIDIKKPVDEFMVQKVMSEEGLKLLPHQFVLVQTIETVYLSPCLVGRVEGRSSLGRLGIMVHITAGYIDPGFSGQITLEIVNLSQNIVRLYPGMRIAQLSLTQITSEPTAAYGERNNKYQKQAGVTPSRIWKDF